MGYSEISLQKIPSWILLNYLILFQKNKHLFPLIEEFTALPENHTESSNDACKEPNFSIKRVEMI